MIKKRELQRERGRERQGEKRREEKEREEEDIMDRQIKRYLKKADIWKECNTIWTEKADTQPADTEKKAKARYRDSKERYEE